MPVTDVTTDIDAHTLTVIADFAASPERVWQVYADPRQLEQIWGPPGYPATVVEHSLTPGGRVTYYMTSPEGERYHGLWDIDEVSEPESFTFRDAFADAEFQPAEGMPVARNVFSFRATDAGTRMETTTRYESAEALQQVLDMGMEEGLRGAIGQVDDLLAAG